MKKLLLITLILSFNLSSAPYETAQRFQEGDTISADVLNDILDRIELSLKDVTVSELVGEWDATQYLCTSSLSGWGVDLTERINGGPVGCLLGEAMTGAISREDGLYAERTDNVTIAAVNDSTTSFTWAQSSYNFIFNHSLGYVSDNHNTAQTHTCSIIGGAALMSCKLDISKWFETNAGGADRNFSASMNVQRLSDTRIKFFFGPWRAGGLFNVIILDKKAQPSKAPTGLAISLSAGTAALTWTAGDATETGYDVKRKASSDGTYASIGTPTAESYNDSTIAKGNSYWYRVFATNANGTSVGSNVIQITYSNTPPSMNLSSTISVNEGTTSVVTIGATDADEDSLTYTISNPNASTDAEDLSVSSEGVITFNASPDWEIPTDYNTDNIYDIRVSVSDGTDTVSQDVSVVVLDVDGS